MISKRPRIFYGWLIVFVSAIGLFLGPPLMIFSFSVFFKSLVVDFHASRAAVSFAFSLFNTVGALLIPCIGMLIDRFGAKRVILLFTLLYGLGLCSALWVGSALWQLYLLFAMLGVAMASGPSPVPYGVVIAHWFNRHRGLALGLSMMGIGVGSVVVPILTQRLIAGFGWRAALRSSEAQSSWCRSRYLRPCYRMTPDNAVFSQMEARKVRFHNYSHRTRV